MVIPEVVTAAAEKVGIIPPVGSTRKVKFPYTVTQQVGHFPWKFHYQKLWFFRYTVYAVIVSWPLFNWIGRQTRSPGNYARVAAQKKKDAEKERELHDH